MYISLFSKQYFRITYTHTAHAGATRCSPYSTLTNDIVRNYQNDEDEINKTLDMSLSLSLFEFDPVIALSLKIKTCVMISAF